MFFKRKPQDQLVELVDDEDLSASLPDPPDAFKDIFHNAKHTHYFREFLRKRHAVENMLFVEAIDIYKAIDDQKWQWKAAQHMIDMFVADHAKYPVTLASPIREKLLKKKIFAFNRTTFDDAKHDVLDLMKTNYFDAYSQHLVDRTEKRSRKGTQGTHDTAGSWRRS